MLGLCLGIILIVDAPADAVDVIGEHMGGVFPCYAVCPVSHILLAKFALERIGALVVFFCALGIGCESCKKEKERDEEMMFHRFVEMGLFFDCWLP